MPRALAQAAKSARMELQDFLYVASHADVEADGIPTPAFANDRASKKRGFYARSQCYCWLS